MSEPREHAGRRHEGEERAILDLADELIESAYDLEADGDVTEVARRVGGRMDEILTILRGHHASEEEPGALFESLRQALPHRIPRVDELQQEHASIIERLEKVRDGLASSDPRGGELAREARYIAAWIRRHESSEIELLYEMALGDDLRGGGD